MSAERAGPEAIRFYVDPLCPWCYQTMRWAMRLEALGEVMIEWRVFSLAIANKGDEARADPEMGSGRALRTAVAVRNSAGNQSMGRFFAALGAAIHQRKQEAGDVQTIRQALSDAGIDTAIADRALSDPMTWQAVVAEHDALVAEHKAFGVPTIVLNSGAGPVIFGPVISELPDDKDAVEMWRHVSWLVRNEGFSELKRERLRRPDFRSVNVPSSAGKGKSRAA